MQSGGGKTFWLSFLVTLMVLLPLIGAVWLLGIWEDHTAFPAERTQEEIPIRRPGPEHAFNVLVAVAGERPAFLLLRLDAPSARISVTALPAESVLSSGGRPRMLSESYQQAGPARAAGDLAETLGIDIRYYLAISRDSLTEAFGTLGPARINLTGLLSRSQREADGLADPVQEFTPAAASDFLQEVSLAPPALAALRGAVWEGFMRQQLDRLPADVPQGLRRVSSSLLTNLTALDLYTLGDTLEFLADGGGRVEQTPAPGHWSVQRGRFEFSGVTSSWAARQFGGSGDGPVYDPWQDAPEETTPAPPETGRTGEEMQPPTAGGL